ARHRRTAARRRRFAGLFRATGQTQDARRSCRARLRAYSIFKRHLCALALSRQTPRSRSPRRGPARRQFGGRRSTGRYRRPRAGTDAANLHCGGPRSTQACDCSRRVGANSGNRIFSLVSEPSPNAAGAQGLGGFSAQGAPRRVIVLTSVLLAAAHGSAFGTKRTSLVAPHMSAIGGKADIIQGKADIKKCPLMTQSRHPGRSVNPFLNTRDTAGLGFEAEVALTGAPAPLSLFRNTKMFSAIRKTQTSGSSGRTR